MSFDSRTRLSLVLLPLGLLLAALGWWQLDRMNEKQALFDDFEGAGTMTLEQALQGEIAFARISATGRFDTRRHILLDNKMHEGRVGVHVFTPFQTFDGTVVLVNRGWKPMAADRRSLPEVWTPAVPVGIRGILAPPPEHRQKLGAPDELSSDDRPQLVTYLDLEEVAETLQLPLPGWVVWLDSDDPAGFEGRDWSPAVTTPARHRAYAVQWFALAVTVVVIWLVLMMRSRRRASSGRDGG